MARRPGAGAKPPVAADQDQTCEGFNPWRCRLKEIGKADFDENLKRAEKPCSGNRQNRVESDYACAVGERTSRELSTFFLENSEGAIGSRRGIL